MTKMFLIIRRALAGAAFLCAAGMLQAAPFDREFAFTQPDGTVLQIHGTGDEFYAVFETPAGYTVIFDPQKKAYCYGHTAGNGELKSTGVEAQKPAPQGLAKHQRMSQEARKAQVRARWQQWENGMQIESRWKAVKEAYNATQATAASAESTTGKAGSPNKTGGGTVAPKFQTLGTKVGLTLLIDFADDVATITAAEIDGFCNNDNYTGYGNNGSVKKYFQDNSASLLTYSNVVTFYVRAPRPKSYYNDVTQDAGQQGQTLIKDCMDVLKATPNYTTQILPLFDNLTTTAGNEVVAFNIFYAGDNGGVWTMGLWPHSGGLATSIPLGNGKNVRRYQITNIGNTLELGTFCHENGHMLMGYPDIYDYDYDSSGGAGGFCLMNSGGHGVNPVQICAYLKRMSGWAQNTVELNSLSSLVASVSAGGTNFNKFYRYVNPNVATEYFLMENRQQSGRDANIPGSGLAIWHIDELGDHNDQSTNYNSAHWNFEVSLMQADNRWHLQDGYNSGDENDLYYANNPSAGYKNEFSDTSAPAAKWWNGINSGLKITEISASLPTMTFRVGTGDTGGGGGGGGGGTNTVTITAPQPPWGTNMAVFNGSNPNGDWMLFVQDDKQLDAGQIASGWMLSLTTANPVGFAADNAVYATPGAITIPALTRWNYTLAVTNYGPSSSTNVVVTGQLPTGASLVSAIPSVGSVVPSGSQLLWNVGNLPIHSGGTMQVSLLMSTPGTFTSSTHVGSGATADPNPDDDLAETTVTVVNVAPPVIAPGTFGPGGFHLNISGAGYPVTIQASTNLVNWVDIYSATAPFPFTDTNAASYPARFYRAIYSP